MSTLFVDIVAPASATTVTVSGSLSHGSYVKYTTNTVLANPMADIIGIGASGSFALTLPDAAGAHAGKRIYVKDVSGSAGTHNIVITPSGSQTIDGAANYTLSSNYAAAGIATDGSNWFII